MNKRAFTLAEVLLTLTIIGVIAALTIPNLMKKYENHVLLTQLKNWYSEFSNTIGQFKAQNDNVWEVFDETVEFPGFNGKNEYNNNKELTKYSAFIEFLDNKYGDLYKGKYSNMTSWSNVSSSLWLDKHGVRNYKTLSGAAGADTWPDLHYYFYAYKTYRCKSGAMFGIKYQKDPNGSKAWTVVVDVNGPKKGPNIVGRDTFHFYIDDNSAKLFGRYSTSGYYMYNYGTYANTGLCDTQITSTNNGVTCARKIMLEGWQMNY